MWKIVKIFILASALFFVLSVFAKAQPMDINLYLFYGEGCPHCLKEEAFLNKLKSEDPRIKVHAFETWKNKDNQELLKKLGRELGVSVSGVPVLFIGRKAVVGFFNEATTGEQIRSLIREHEASGCLDEIAPLLDLTPESGDGNECAHGCDADDAVCMHDCGCNADTTTPASNPDLIHLPFFGEVNAKKLSLPLLTVTIAAADGFNPCAMWILLFLISLLLGMQNRTKMWILGSAFIFSSSLVYFLFLAAWLNIFLYIGFIKWLRLAIGVVALVSGVMHLKKVWRNRQGGCEVLDDEKRTKMFARLKGVIENRSFWLALVGIVFLAAAVNLVELVCSAGLPAVYTQVLALSGLPVWQYYAYLLLYIFIFMLDDLLVFIVAMFTLQMKAVGIRFARYSGWVGGIIMLALGLLLIFKPEWIMFG